MSEQLYEPIIRDMTWSYSRIESFVNCPYSFYLKYISFPKVAEDKMFYSSYGTWCHELIAGYYTGRIAKEELPIKFISEFKNQVKGKRPPVSTVEKWINSGLSYFNNFEEFKTDTLDVERRFEFRFAGYPFVGIIDYIGIKNGAIYIIDNKSADIKERSERAKPTLKDMDLDKKLRQLYIYSAPVKELYGEYPAKLCFNCFRVGRIIEEDFNLKEYNKVLDWVKNRIEEIAACEVFNPNCDYFYCNYICGFKSQCCYAEDKLWG